MCISPLEATARALPCQLVNIAIVWFLTGFWHGANWNFILWGLYYCVLLILEKTFLLPLLKKGRVWPHIYTLLLVMVGWAFFVGSDVGVQLPLLLQRLFVPTGGVSALYFLRNYAVLLVVCCVCSTQLPGRFWQWCKGQSPATGSALRRLLCSVHGVCGSSNGFHRTVCKLLREGMALWKNMFTADPTVICRQLP